MKTPPASSNNTPYTRRAFRMTWIAGLAVAALSGMSPLHAATSSWTGGDSNNNWFTGVYSNWNPASSPAGNDVLFGSVGLTANSSTVSSTVNSNVTINSLKYQYTNNTNWHVTEITSGNTLTVTGASNVFTVGGYYGNLATNLNQTTLTAIRGEGTLSVSQAGGTIFIGNIRTNAIDPALTVPKVVLDMHELSTFSANLGTTGIFSVGSANRTNSTSFQATLAEVHLAKTNTITTGSLEIGSSLSGANYLLRLTNAAPTLLYLGLTNKINVDNVYIASGGTGNNFSAYAKMAFDDSVTNSSPVAVFRGTNGSGRIANFYVAARGNWTTGGGGQIGTADFTGGEVDMLVDTMIIGRGTFNAAGTTNSGTFTMSKGTVDATSVTLGIGYNTANSLVQGTLNINGGSFIAKDLVSGQNPGNNATAGSVEGIINVTSNGSLTVTNTLEMAKSQNNSAGNTAPLKSTLNISDSATVEVKSGGIKMGTRGGSSDAAAITTTINLDGGSLTVHGNIEEGTTNSGAVTSTFNLNGGTLDMQTNKIIVDTFNAKSGKLMNVTAISTTNAAFEKTTTGTLTLAGNNTFTNDTKVSAGTLKLDSASGKALGSAASITVMTNATLLISQSYQVTNAATAVTLSGGTIKRESGVSEVFGNLNLTTGSFLDYGSGDTGTLTFGTYDTPSSLLTVSNFFQGNKLVFGSDLTSTISNGTYFSFGGQEFDSSWNGSTFTITAIPEPTACAAAAILLGLMLWPMRKRRALRASDV